MLPNNPAIKTFVTGTDTEVGKTLMTAALLAKLRQHHGRCFGLKPVASGCEVVDGRLVSGDAALLAEHATPGLTMAHINPIRFQHPIAPHIAAQQQGQTITAAMLQQACQIDEHADHILIEGFGGWHVPYNDEQYMSDFVAQHFSRVVLVVGLKLGCLNHALLTQMAIEASGCQLVGWIANQIDPHMDVVQQNVATLQQHLRAPMLGWVPYQQVCDATQIHHHFDTTKIQTCFDVSMQTAPHQND